MDGPITCEQLRNIKKVFEDAEFNKYVSELVNNIKQSVIQYAYNGTNTMLSMPAGVIAGAVGKHVYKADVTYLCRGVRNQCSHLFDKSKMFDSIVSGLQEVFPDMKIMADPLKTYLLLDWS